MRSLFLALHLSTTSAWAGPDGPSKFDATALGAQRYGYISGNVSQRTKCKPALDLK